MGVEADEYLFITPYVCGQMDAQSKPRIYS